MDNKEASTSVLVLVIGGVDDAVDYGAEESHVKKIDNVEAEGAAVEDVIVNDALEGFRRSMPHTEGKLSMDGAGTK